MKILFTGGGSAGHVTPNIALIEHFQQVGWDIVYVGSVSGIERELIASVPYQAISSGKLRRYFDWQNFTDPFRILWGFLQSLVICLRERPEVVFSKGGFVAVPIVFAAWLWRIPVICHESDVTPGLANKLCFPVVQKICINFPETARYIKHADKTVVTGTPIRRSLLNGNKQAACDAFGLSADQPTLLVFGGSLGATAINQMVRASLVKLLESFQVVHVVGVGNISDIDIPGYVQREFLHDEFGDVLALADVVVARAGANTIYELLVSRKPHILIPLSSAASRGDQLYNAKTFSTAGYSRILDEKDGESLVDLVLQVHRDRQEIVHRIEEFAVMDSVAEIADLVSQVVERRP